MNQIYTRQIKVVGFCHVPQPSIYKDSGERNQRRHDTGYVGEKMESIPGPQLTSWNKGLPQFNLLLFGIAMIEKYLEELKDYIETTDYHYREIYEDGLTTHPIPFFGNIQTAKILTVGANPSNGEFKDNDWPPDVSTQYLSERLINYFSNPKFPPYWRWFNIFEKAINILGFSYCTGEVAHLDCSPRATIPMRQIPKENKDIFLEMVERDIEWFFKLLPYCQESKLIIIAGSVSGKTKRKYLNEVIGQFAPNFGFNLIGEFDRKKRGRAKTAFQQLKGQCFDKPVFFCGSSPSDKNKPPPETGEENWLVFRIMENKKKLLSPINDIS